MKILRGNGNGFNRFAEWVTFFFIVLGLDSFGNNTKIVFRGAESASDSGVSSKAEWSETVGGGYEADSFQKIQTPKHVERKQTPVVSRHQALPSGTASGVIDHVAL